MTASFMEFGRLGLGERLERTLQCVGKEKPNKRIFVRKAQAGGDCQVESHGSETTGSACGKGAMPLSRLRT